MKDFVTLEPSDTRDGGLNTRQSRQASTVAHQSKDEVSEFLGSTGNLLAEAY